MNRATFISSVFILPFVVSSIASAGQAGQTPYPGGPLGPRARAPVAETSKAESAQASDAEFLKKADTAGQLEMDLADLADKQAESVDVKALADRIRSDHMRTAVSLEALASSKEVELPKATPDASIATNKRLSALSGSSFDRAYLDQMVQDHRQAIDDFTKAAKSNDPDVRRFAEQTLPALKDHLRQSEDLQKSIEKAK